MHPKILSIINSERGAALVEWSLLVALIALVVLVAVSLAGQEMSTTYSGFNTELVNAGT